MKRYKCVIIDDDQYAIDAITGYLQAVPGLDLLKAYQNPVEALMEIPSLVAIDLVLLDINMPQLSGIQVSKEIRLKTQKLIFTTSYKEYGYEAFEAEADGYLLKPFSLQKFTVYVSKILGSIRTDAKRENTDQFFFVKNRNEDLRIVKVWYKDIVAVEAQQNYVLIHTSGKKIMTYMSLSEISKTLIDRPDFVQFQRSFIIAKSHIDSITGNSIKMDSGLNFVVGEKYRAGFQTFIKDNLLRTG